MHIIRQDNSGLTRRLLLTVTSDGADNGILLPGNAVGGAVDVILGLRGGLLSFASSVLLLAGLSPRLAAGHLANLLDQSTLG